MNKDCDGIIQVIVYAIMNFHRLFLTFALLLFLFHTPVPASAQESAPLDVQISIPGLGEKEFIVGETISLQVTLINTSSNSIYILPPLDGSTYGRFPRYTQSVIRPLPVDYVPDGLICGTFNPLRLEDFVLLLAGESYILPYPYFSWKPYTAGEYEVSLHIDFNGTPEQYRGAPIGDSTTVAPELLEKLDQVPKVEIESNQVKVNVVSNGKTLDPRVHCLMGMTRDEVMRLFYVHEQSSNLFSILYMGYHGLEVTVHFDAQDKVDGVQMGGVKPGQEDEFQIWARGLDELELEQVSWYEIWDGLDATYMYYSISTGWFQTQQYSSVSLMEFYK